MLINLNLLISFRNTVANVATKSEFIRRQGQRFRRIGNHMGFNLGP